MSLNACIDLVCNYLIDADSLFHPQVPLGLNLTPTSNLGQAATDLFSLAGALYFLKYCK